MVEALKARHPWIVLVVSIGLGLAVAVMAGVDVPVPFLSSLGNSALPFPVLPAMALAVVVPSLARQAEPQSAPPCRRNAVGHSVGFVAVACAAYMMVGAGLTALLAPDPAVAWLIVSDAACLVALSLASRWLWSAPAMSALPVLLVVLQSMFARDNTGMIRPWAWLMTRDWYRISSIVGLCGWSFTFAAVLFAVVLVVARRPLCGSVQENPLVAVGG